MHTDLSPSGTHVGSLSPRLCPQRGPERFPETNLQQAPGSHPGEPVPERFAHGAQQAAREAGGKG